MQRSDHASVTPAPPYQAGSHQAGPVRRSRPPSVPISSRDPRIAATLVDTMATDKDRSNGPDQRLTEVEDELYGVAPAEFLSRRDDAVRAAKERGDRELAGAIASLRKPTAAAWALDSYARAHPSSIDGLLAVGSRLRDAVDRGDGDTIRDVMRERARTVTAVVREVRRHAEQQGESMSSTVAAQAERTLRAAMSSDEHADMLRRGVLAAALDEPGLDGMVASDAPRRTTGGPAGASRPAAPSRADRRRRESAERRVSEAADAVERAEGELAAASTRRGVLEIERDRLRRLLDDIENRLRTERYRESEAEDRLRAARTGLHTARSAFERDTS
jgi:hypothetical protein